ncbi:DUF2341 domain-containing protein, partial [Candidatus Dojkabacteria bacterium]|nr:DUF2341 domain-containing protein [Candidatus Dojkabacteria bacterium]
MVKDKLPTRKKRIITAIILVFSVLAPLLILLIVKNIEKDQGWFNSSWLYRRSLHVSGSGSSLLSEEILIEYDTESLILSNKLLPNCADLRFVDSDNHSLLQYWIEGGCNTTTTHIWVRIPTIPRGGKTIYMYYGNTEAVSAQEAWHGKFFLLNNQTCETNWEIESNPTNPFYQKFFMGLNEYGQSGGEAKHTHNESNVTKEMLEGTLAVKLGEDSTVAKEHKHKVSFETERSEILPPYYDLLVCSNSQLTLPTNSILLFDKESPKEFTRFKELDNKFPRGSDTPNTFSDEGEHTHHIENINIENLADTSKCALGNTEISSLKHIHTLESLSVSKEKIMPPYIEMIFAQNENSTMAPSGSITISSALPPLGWALFEPLENRFPLGQSEYGNTGGSETHAHSYNITLSKSKELEKCSLSTGKQNFAVGQHNHNLSGELQLGSSIPPYISVLYIKKKDSLKVTVNDETLNLPPNPPTELLVNKRRSPLISIFNPSFSAVFSDPNKEDTGEYFQIEISTDSTFSSNILWDSKKQSMPSTKNGERSAELKYRGSKLNESLYYWRIKFWDNNGNEGAWSEVSTFRIVKKERVILNGLESQDVLGAKTENYYSEATTENATTSTVYQDKTTLTFTPEANSNYLLISSWLLQQSNTSYLTYSKLTRSSGAAKNFNELAYQPKNGTDYVSGGGIGIDSFGSSPTQQTYKIQYRTSNAAGTARIKEASIFALKLEEEDKYAQVESRSTTTAVTYQDKTTLTFTPSTPGEYIILASATIDSIAPAGWGLAFPVKTALNIDGTPYSEISMLPTDEANRFPWFVVKRVNLNATSHTIKIQYSATQSGSFTSEIGIADARIVVIRADRFSNNYYAEEEARATTTSTAYQTRTTLTATPENEEHLILAVQDLDISSTSQSAYGRVAKGASSYGEMSVETFDANNRGYQYFTVKKETLSNTSTSWYSQYRSSNASATAGITGARISVIELSQSG